MSDKKITAVNASIEINYINSRGKSSKRRIDVRHFELDPHGVFNGYCHTRRMARSFSFRRVSGAVDIDSGLSMDSAALFAWLTQTAAEQNLPPPSDGQKSVYRAPHNPAISDKPQILFTGFPATRKSELQSAANDAGFRVVRNPTAHLAYLVCGQTAGAAKLQAARKSGTPILTEEEFLAILQNKQAV